MKEHDREDDHPKLPTGAGDKISLCLYILGSAGPHHRRCNTHQEHFMERNDYLFSQFFIAPDPFLQMRELNNFIESKEIHNSNSAENHQCNFQTKIIIWVGFITNSQMSVWG